MTAIDRFTVIEQDETGGLYQWIGWDIYWNRVTNEGELYSPDGLFVVAGHNLELLADEAARQENSTR